MTEKGAQREAKIHQQTSYIHKICHANGSKEKYKKNKKKGLWKIRKKLKNSLKQNISVTNIG